MNLLAHYNPSPELFILISALCLILLILLWAGTRRHARKLRDNNQQLSLLQSELEHQATRQQEQSSELAKQIKAREELTKEYQNRELELAEARAKERALEQRLGEHKEWMGKEARLQQDVLAKKEREYSELNQQYLELSKKLSSLTSELDAKQQSLEEQKSSFANAQQQLKVEFQALANQILEEKGKSFAQTNQTSIEALLKPLKQQIEGFQSRVNEVHSESLKGHANLESELKRVLDIGNQMSSEANNLTRALKGEKKTAGNWGEVQLERTLQLAGLERGVHYEAQELFNDSKGKKNYPDFVVKLPDDKQIILDSKVSLIDYDKAIAAANEAEQHQALEAHVKAVRNHIDSLSAKDYSNLIGIRSPSFVLMFMPIEPAYIEAMKHNKELFNYGYQKNVILVSHTTLMPILRTIANLWMLEQSNTEAREISDKAGDIYNQVCTLAEHLQKLGNTLGSASNHYNKAVVALVGRQGLHGKVERFSKISAKVTKSLPELEPRHTDFEHQRLEMVLPETKSPAAEPETLAATASK